MSPMIQFFATIALFFFLSSLVRTYTGNFLTPCSCNDNIVCDDHDHLATHLILAPKIQKLALGRLNTIATTITIIITVLNVVVYKLRVIHEENLREKYKPSEQSCRRFLHADMLSATKNFDESLVIGQGGFGKVYRGVIDDGTTNVAIKRSNSMSKQGAPEFWTEIEMLTKIRHSNIVSLIGYCNDYDEMILVYDYMVHGTLADNIYKNSTKSSLPWAQRVKICIGAARGLDYLHTGTGDRNRIIHRDVKSSNILVGDNWIAKVSDFGMSKIGPTNQLYTHVTTNVKGTIGYVDPEYFLSHQLTRKSDVYAFGVVLFEVLFGRRAVDKSLDVEQRGLAGWAQQCMNEGKLDQTIDPSLRGQILSDSLAAFAQIAGQCLHMLSTERPTMAEVVVALEVALAKQERTDSSIYDDDELFIYDRDYFDNQVNDESSFNKKEAVINSDCNNKDYSDSPVKEHMVIDSNNVLHHDEQIEGIMQLEDASNKKSRVRPAKRMAFTKTVRQFFLGTSHGVSAESDEKLMKNSKSNNDIGEDIIQSREGRDTGVLNLKMFTYAELKAATQDFRSNMMIADGPFATVFKGWVDKKTLEPSKIGMGMTISIKRINLNFPKLEGLKSKLEFWGKCSHPSLVKILGYCWEDSNFFVVHEFMQEGSSESHLYGFAEFPKPLPWVKRLQIAIEAARGLAFLHTSEKEVFFDRFKDSNSLRNGDLGVEVVDFELAKLGIEDKDYLYVVKWLTRNRASKAYAAPECTATGQLSAKSDVYGFGVVLLELLTGQCAIDERWHFGSRYLLEWCMPFLTNRIKLDRVIDTRLKGQYSLECAFEYAALVLKCVDLDPTKRPPMEQVLKNLEHINAINMKRVIQLSRELNSIQLLQIVLGQSREGNKPLKTHPRPNTRKSNCVVSTQGEN